MATDTKSALHTPLCDPLRHPLSHDNGHAACGQSAGLIGEIISARELIDRIVTDAEAALSRLCAR